MMNDTFERLTQFYADGNLPWDQLLPPPEVIAVMETMTPGCALDLGTGTGRAARYMAQRGWTVDAVDFVPQAIEIARERSADFPTITYHVSSVTELSFLHPPYQFALDVGCGHSLDTQVPYAEEVARLIEPNGLFLLYGRLRDASEVDKRPRGFVEKDVFAAFEREFTLDKIERGTTEVRDEVWPSAWFWWRRK